MAILRTRLDFRYIVIEGPAGVGKSLLADQLGARLDATVVLDEVENPFIADFYCEAARLVVEVDGDIHDDQRDHDEARDAILAGRHLRILRFTNDDVVQRLAFVLQHIATVAAESSGG